MPLTPAPEGWAAKFRTPSGTLRYADVIAFDDTGAPWVIFPGMNKARTAQDLADFRGLEFMGVTPRLNLARAGAGTEAVEPLAEADAFR